MAKGCGSEGREGSRSFLNSIGRLFHSRGAEEEIDRSENLREEVTEGRRSVRHEEERVGLDG